MNNELAKAAQSVKEMRHKSIRLLADATTVLRELENLLTFDNLPDAERAAAEELHSSVVMFESQLKWFIR